MIPLPIQQAAYRAGLPALDLVHAIDAPPVGPLHGRARPGRQLLTADQVADLVREFAGRRVPVDVWVKREARGLGVSPATVRRAVYRFDSYAPKGGVS